MRSACTLTGIHWISGEHRGHIASVLQLTGEGISFVGEICPAFAGGKILGKLAHISPTNIC